MNDSKEQAAIDYPCAWNYKVIGIDGERLREAIATVMGSRNFLLTPSHASSGGKYLSMGLETVVEDEVTRNAIYGALKQHPDVKMVL
ncbi:MAG: DUF493 domain-containing protein [Desulfobulbaceae bacterium]|nr:DUF493 domain-containing protein [Desulfobulbaceae bacterium]